MPPAPSWRTPHTPFRSEPDARRGGLATTQSSPSTHLQMGPWAATTCHPANSQPLLRVQLHPKGACCIQRKRGLLGRLRRARGIPTYPSVSLLRCNGSPWTRASSWCKSVKKKGVESLQKIEFGVCHCCWIHPTPALLCSVLPPPCPPAPPLQALAMHHKCCCPCTPKMATHGALCCCKKVRPFDKSTSLFCCHNALPLTSQSGIGFSCESNR